jgi:hypothetical protein
MLTRSIVRAAGYPLLATLTATPLLEGILPVASALVILTPAVVVTLFAYGSVHAPAWTKKLALSLVSMCVMATLIDLIARPILAVIREDRPSIISPLRDRTVPEVYRFRPSSTYSGPLYGDLSAMSGRKEWRETRNITFETDAYGFRNFGSAADDPRPLDLIMLGDSFGVGTGVTQEKTWSSLLQQKYHLSVYNLSVDGHSPWQEYMTLRMEIDRLHVRRGSLLLWCLFEGNDLDETYLPVYEMGEPTSPNILERVLSPVREFRYRSPLRHFVTGQASPREKVVPREIGGTNVLFYRDYIGATARTTEEIKTHTNFKQLEDTISAMSKLTAQKGLRVVTICVPDKSRIYKWMVDGSPPWSEALDPSPFAEVLGEIAHREGFIFLDLTQPVYAAAHDEYVRRPGTLLWWNDDTHWNDLGHQVAAETVYRTLIQNGLSANSQ